MQTDAGTILDAPKIPHANHGQWARALRDYVGRLVSDARVRAGGGARTHTAKEARPVAWPRALAAVLVAIAAHASVAGEAHPSHETLARLTGYSPRHVARVLDEGEGAGLIARAVPSFGARVLGATTRYALPWFAVTVREGLGALARVQRRLPLGSLAQSAGVARALEDAAPAALLGRVVRQLPAEVQLAVIRSGAEVYLARHRAVVQTTPRRDKTSDPETSKDSTPPPLATSPVTPASSPTPPSAGSFAEQLAGKAGRWLAAKRSADPPPRRF